MAWLIDGVLWFTGFWLGIATHHFYSKCKRLAKIINFDNKKQLPINKSQATIVDMDDPLDIDLGEDTTKNV